MEKISRDDRLVYEMKVLVTGATGFIGSHLVPTLAKRGYKVRCLVRNEKRASKLKKLKDVEVFIGDITKSSTLKGIAQEVDAVYHLAALMGHDPPSPEAFEKFRKVNTEGTLNVLNECKEMPLKKFLLFSTTAVLGIPKDKIITEKYAANPYTPYQVTKYESENLVLEFYEKYKLPGVIIRPCKVYGPGFVGDFLTIAKVVKRGVFPILGHGDNLFPAIHVDDLIQGAVLALEKGRPGEIYLLAANESYPLKHIIQIIADHLGVRGIWIYTPRPVAQLGAFLLEAVMGALGRKPPITYRNISSVTTSRVFDISKAKRDLGFSPKANFEKELKKTLDWFIKEGYL